MGNVRIVPAGELMSFMYLDLESSQLGESKSSPWKVVVVTHKNLNDKLSPLRMHTEWGEGTELAALEKFEKETRYFSKKWSSVPVGWNISGYDLPTLKKKGIQYGFIEFAKEFEKPFVDLQQLGYLWNFLGKVPDDIEYQTEIPGCFYNAKLSEYSSKRGAGTYVPQMYRDRRFRDIELYAEQEAWAFVALWEAVTEEAPKWWKQVLAPKLGIDTRKREAPAAKSWRQPPPDLGPLTTPHPIDAQRLYGLPRDGESEATAKARPTGP
jgi:hypothetical protein